MNIVVLDASTPFFFSALAKTDDAGRLSLLNGNISKVSPERDDWTFKSFETLFKDANSFSAHEINAFYMGNGPGSFTGLRSLFAFMRTLSMLDKIPLITFHSLAFWHSILAHKSDDLLLTRVNRNLFYLYDPETPDTHSMVNTTSALEIPGNREILCRLDSWRGESECPFPKASVVSTPEKVSSLPFAQLPPDWREEKHHWHSSEINYGHELNFLPLGANP